MPPFQASNCVKMPPSINKNAPFQNSEKVNHAGSWARLIEIVHEYEHDPTFLRMHVKVRFFGMTLESCNLTLRAKFEILLLL